MRAEPTWERRRCLTCRATKPRADFRDGRSRRCDACRERLETCMLCGAPTASYGRRTCDGCSEEAQRRGREAGTESQRERWARWRPPPTKVCTGCGLSRPRDEEHFAVFARYDDGTPRHLDACCRPCRRAYQRARYRSDPGRRAKQLAAARRQRERILADPDELERQRERRKVWNQRQRRRRRGEHVPDGRRRAEDRPQGPRNARRLPAAPLTVAVERALERERALRGEGYSEERACEALGMSDRLLRAWRSGERAAVQLDVADRVLDELGLNWWDVWSEADYPEVAECLAA